MARPKSNKSVKSINFDDEVLRALESKCRKERVLISAFVNNVIKRAVMSEFEYYRQMTKNSAIDLAKYQTLMDTALDKPREM